MEDEAEVKVVPDKRSSSHSASSKAGESVYSVAADTEDIYKVPTSNEPVENMGENMLYKVGHTKGPHVKVQIPLAPDYSHLRLSIQTIVI